MFGGGGGGTISGIFRDRGIGVCRGVHRYRDRFGHILFKIRITCWKKFHKNLGYRHSCQANSFSIKKTFENKFEKNV